MTNNKLRVNATIYLGKLIQELNEQYLPRVPDFQIQVGNLVASIIFTLDTSISYHQQADLITKLALGVWTENSFDRFEPLGLAPNIQLNEMGGYLTISFMIYG